MKKKDVMYIHNKKCNYAQTTPIQAQNINVYAGK